MKRLSKMFFESLPGHKILWVVPLSLQMLSCIPPAAVSPQALAMENACVQSLQAQDYTGAQTRCELCLEYDAGVPECVNGLGLVAYYQHDNPTAVKYFTQAIQMSSTFAQARNNLGAIYFGEFEYEQALPLFQAAVQIDPGYEDARYNLALSYLRLGQKAQGANDQSGAKNNYASAQGQYAKIIAIDPGYANAYRDLGLIMTYLASLETVQTTLQADLDKANGYFKQCIQVDPQNESCHESYGHTLLYQNQYDQALYQFVQCLAANKKNPVCIQGMTTAYQGSQIKGQALGTYIQTLQNNPQDPNGHYGYCVALFQKGINDLAVSECETAIKLDPKLCLAYYQLGMYYKTVLNTEQALSNCRSFLLCDQTTADAKSISQCQSVVTTLSSQ